MLPDAWASLATAMRKALSIGTRRTSAWPICFVSRPGLIRWSSAKRKSWARSKRPTKLRAPAGRQVRSCIAFFNAPFALPNRFARTLKSRAVRSQSVPLRWNLQPKFSAISPSRKVLILGAGEVSERTARALKSRGVSDLRVANRSFERAHELAQAVSGRAAPFEDWKQQCAEVDILISSTSAGSPLLDAQSLGPILRSRVDRPLFIIDIAVPRDVAPDVNQLPGVFLYDIDSLQSVAAQSLDLRRRQIAAAESIITGHTEDFWQSHLRRNGDGAQPSTVAPISVPELRTSQS